MSPHARAWLIGTTLEPMADAMGYHMSPLPRLPWANRRQRRSGAAKEVVEDVGRMFMRRRSALRGVSQDRRMNMRPTRICFLLRIAADGGQGLLRKSMFAGQVGPV
jgi:hypothetical protein